MTPSLETPAEAPREKCQEEMVHVRVIREHNTIFNNYIKIVYTKHDILLSYTMGHVPEVLQKKINQGLQKLYIHELKHHDKKTLKTFSLGQLCTCLDTGPYLARLPIFFSLAFTWNDTKTNELQSPLSNVE